MKLLSFTYKNGNGGHKKSYGIWARDGVIDLGKRMGDRYPTIKSLLAGQALAEAAVYRQQPPDHCAEAISYLPVIEDPGKIICVGMNYAEKRLEFNEKNNEPTLFIRFADSQTGHNATLLKPGDSSEFDYEGELAVIIGKSCFRTSVEHAMQFVAGYSCYMDGSVRDWQHTWYTAGKNWPLTGSFGPYLTTQDEVDDPQALGIRTWLNGRIVQDDNTGNMVHKIAELISYISTFTHLKPGDVIITGSPGGVGKKRVPPLFLRQGDRIEVEIEGLGRLSNTVSEAHFMAEEPCLS
ncbi:fumarylacetoacetate hydrolase family protein [Enterobacillus tribolii]|uniref:2-keto-4-pentenoate hydratase/2-oxohepta-3-ene-1,7-dioic acid hydratase in catechol pathway n=1 Tax=Enterobacillus tribolii TaxID=1487935 RepID=A0A370QEJ4_9GAMM|nr:fumarylacetoacetate hydrolase family protein [Enterobacillus tribolii]MBW7984156.1 FAA hydrolase family protein [Enterobacillus tribolii]RDK86783.1 2-keto-4-pentenoate hydratase/2-oxohepta-3-ene-1,7-dioic acid hydratase in catechol pathway [Enterobacillus tribolii]